MRKNLLKITQRGMITIPLYLQKKYHLTEGTEITLMEDEGKLILIPLIDIEVNRSLLPTKEEMSKIIDADHEIELELEK